MFENSPVFLLLVLIIILILLIRKSIVDHKFYKEFLLTLVVLIFSYAMIILFYEQIKSNHIAYLVYQYFSIAILLLTLIFIYTITSNNINKKSFLNEILLSLDDSTLYLLLNKKNKVIEISSNLCNKFNVKKEDIVGRNIEVLLDEYITIEKINSKNVSNNEFLLYLKDIIPENHKAQLEIKYLKSDGSEEEINITESSIYTTDKYFGRMYLGKIEQIVESKSKTDDSFKVNYLMDILNEGAFKYSFIDKSLYINDYLVKELDLVGNSLSLNDVLYNISEEDYNNLKLMINNASRENSNINTVISYKFKDGTKTYLKTNIIIIFDGINRVEMVGSILINNSKQFININSSVLDNMHLEDMIQSDIKTLAATETKFEVVTFKILDIKDINNKYSRQLGTLIIEEYIRSIKNAFEINDMIYRITGTRFAFILTDLRQMEKLTRALTNNKLLTPTLSYGPVNIKLNVIMGISFNNDSIRKDEIYLNSKYALKKAKEYKKQYMFYRDLIN